MEVMRYLAKFSVFNVGLIVLGLASQAMADVTVVFNEVMYHPSQTNEAVFEWIELRNQMAVDMDISGWTISNGVDYRFPENTVIAGGGYLVVASSPVDFTATTGVTNVVGPFTGRLSNNGETLELRNNNQRLMDKLDYGMDGAWPCAPDGAGPSLAKIDEDGPASDPANWRTSRQMSGSPGMPNTPVISVTVEPTAVRLDSTWRYRTNESAPEATWNALGYDDSTWDRAPAVFTSGSACGWTGAEAQSITTLFNSGLNLPGQADSNYVLTASTYSTPPPPNIPATVMVNHANWLANNTTSRWIGPVASGTTSVPVGNYNFRTTFSLSGMDTNSARITLRFAADNRVTNVFLNGIAKGLTNIGFSTLCPASVLSNNFVSGINALDFFTVNDAPSASPAGFRVEASGTANWMPTNTVLVTSQATKYFRTTFVVNGDPGTATLALRTVLDDGAVYYLNGAEVLRLNIPDGPVSHETRSITNVAKASLSTRYSLSTDALVKGTNVLAVEVHQGETGSNDMIFGAELSLTVTNGLLPALPQLTFNELPCVTNQVFWAEILNTGTQPVTLSNYIFKRFGTPDCEYEIPSQTLPPGGYLVINRADLGFGADPGDMLVLYTANKKAVVDAVLAKHYSRARYPEGTGPWLHPSETTPGTTNRVALRDDIVINEIMYHPRDMQGPATNSPEQWVELFNRTANTVDLTDWRLEIDGKTAYRFPAGRMLAGNSYLVVAHDAVYLQGLYPSVDIVGDLSSRLPGGGGKIELFDNAALPLDPTVNPDAGGNPVDVVHYRDNSPWPSSPDGLGSSLELRDPRADNSRPEAWAASDDRAKVSWQTYTYRGIAAAETATSPTLWKEFLLGLIGEGEVLLDDVRVIQSPSGVATQMLQNTSFESGTNTWRLIGNHRHSEVIVDPDNAANHVLRLVADGYTEHMHNHAETTLTNNLSVAIGREYEISYRAKWVSGCNRLLTRLYFNKLPKLTEITQPVLNGTPGARNSRYQANIGPTFVNLSHTPVVPTSGQPVTVSVTASEPDSVATGVLHYAVNSGAWQTLPITPQAMSGGATTLSAVVPGQASGSIVQFYIEATDGLGAKANYPADGTNSRALFEVSNGAALLPRLHTVRFVMTPTDATYLHNAINVMSNERLGCTLITDEKTVSYDAAMHLQGSERGRPDVNRVGFTVRMPSDRPYRGVLDGITVDRSGGYTAGKGGDQDEILLKNAINKAGGLPGMYDDLCQVFAPRASEDGVGLLILAKYDSEFLDTQYTNGGDGDMFKLELIYYPTTTLTGDVQSYKIPANDGVCGTDIKDLGNNPESYRWTFLKENHTDRNNYGPMVTLAKAFSLTGTALDTQMKQLMDVDEWMRGVAFLALLGGNDMYSFGNSHNVIFYFRPEDNKAMLFPWDMDYSFTMTTNSAFLGTGSANTLKLINLPSNLHAYYGHLYDLASITGNSAYMGRWATHYAGLVGQDWGGAVTYLKDRANYVRSQLPLSTPFAITNNLGNGFGVTNSPVTLGGTGAVTVKSITINGVTYPVTWTTVTNWTVTVPLPEVANLLTLQAYDLHGLILSNAWDTLSVTNYGLLAPKPVLINEWMADNSGPTGYPDPVDQKFQDWFELYNPNYVSVDLSGYTLTDTLSTPAKWAIPTNTVIAQRGFLLVWADDEPLQNGTGPYNDLHAPFKLSNTGEALGLFSPAGVQQHALTFGPQLQNVSQGFFTDGNTNALYSMTNWTPRAANQIGTPPVPGVSAIDIGTPAAVSINLQVAPNHAYVVQYKDDLRTLNWLPLVTNRSPVNLSTFIDDTTSGVTQRFYRAILLQ
jgi:hypothetical protein